MVKQLDFGHRNSLPRNFFMSTSRAFSRLLLRKAGLITLCIVSLSACEGTNKPIVEDTRSRQSTSSVSSASSSSIESGNVSSSAAVQSSSSSGPVIPDTDPSAQGGLAISENKFLGNIVNNYVPTHFGTYWNQVTPENAGKWGSVEYQRDNMYWTDLDRAYGYAKANGMPFKLHTLVWGSQEPAWLADLTPAEQLQEVEEWIAALAERYPDVEMVDVVNEPLHAPPSYKDAIGGDGASGWDWVIWSFSQARTHFPNAELHINDYGIVNSPQDVTRYREIIQLLINQGLIDAIGVQSHAFSLNDLSANALDYNLDSLAELQLPIYISEWDIDDTEQVNQLLKYQELFPVAWEHPAVAGVTIWGYIEGETWRSEFNSGLIQPDGSPKPALQWLINYFAQRP